MRLLFSYIFLFGLIGSSLAQDIDAKFTSNNSLSNNAWSSTLSQYPLLAARYNWNIVPHQKIKSVANLTLEDSELEFQNEFSVEETTPKSSKQLSNGFLYRNNNYNPSLNGLNPSYNPLNPSYNPYNSVRSNIDPLSTNYNPLNTNYNPLTTTFAGAGEDGLDAFSARRASVFSLGVGTKIRFQDTITQLGTSWDSTNSEFAPTLPGIFFFTFSAITDRYTYCRISLQLNGEDVVSAFGDLSGYQTASNSAIVRMSVGDRVYLTLQEGRLYDVSSSRAYTAFSGFRVL